MFLSLYCACVWHVVFCVFLYLFLFFFSSRRRHTRCALVTGVQTCALPILPRRRRPEPSPIRCAGWLIVAGLLQPVGNLVITMVANVPLNNRLARVIPDSAEGAVVWTDYLKRWTAWNHVRTLSAQIGRAHV